MRHSWSSAGDSPRILVVDDDSSLLALLRIMLSSQGYEVVATSDAREALGLTETRSFDLVLLDLEMPGMDGREFFGEFRGRGKTTPVVIISAYGAEAASAQLGAEGAVAKPFDPARLADVVRETLESRA